MQYASGVFAKKFTKFEESLVVKLSNGVLQFFWKDGGLSLKGYKWITYKVGGATGEGTIFGSHPPLMDEKVSKVKEFLKVFS